MPAPQCARGLNELASDRVAAVAGAQWNQDLPQLTGPVFVLSAGIRNPMNAASPALRKNASSAAQL